MLRGVIFDVDGTLVDSVELHARAWADAFREFGRDIGLQAIRKQIGKGGDQLLPVFFDEREIDTFGDALVTRRAQILKESYLPSVKGFPGVRDLFRRLLADNVRIALASSAKQDELQVYKKRAGIEDLISAETSADDAKRTKPHPDIFQAALAKLGGVARQDILVVGDTPYDAEAAAKAGLRTVGVLCGGFTEEELRGAGCIAIYRDPADLLARYDQSPLAQASLREGEFYGGDAMSNTDFSTPPNPSSGGGGNGSGASTNAGSVADQARQAGMAAADHARDVASEARARASSLAGTLKESATSIGEAQKDKAAEALESVAKAIHQTGAQLEGNQEWAARLVERGAAELNTLATSLRRNDIEGLIGNLGDLARRQPAVFVGASMAAGFLLTRIGRLAAEGATETNMSATGASATNANTTYASNGTTPQVSPEPAVPIYASEARNGQY